MKLIRPTEVTGKILSLIEDAKIKLVIVSPYNKFSDWEKLKRCLLDAKKRNVEISYYARKGEDNESTKLIGVKPQLIDFLHAKLYFNESYAILSSMNLVEASDKKSLDFAIISENENEYSEIVNYFNNYICVKVLQVKTENDEIPFLLHFSKTQWFKNSNLELHKIYFIDSMFIRELGFKRNRQKVGIWYYFNSSGLLISLEHYKDEYLREEITYNKTVSRYDIVFSLGNIIGGLCNCSIKHFYFKSLLSDYLRNNQELVLKKIEQIFEVNNLNRESITVEDLTENIHDLISEK